MVKCAVRDFFPAGYPVVVDPIEVDNGPSIPTVELMVKLQEIYEDTHKVHFVMGSDLLDSLHLWNDGQKMIDEIPLVVFRRKSQHDEETMELESHPNFPKNDPIFIGDDKSMIGVISSTEVRKRVKQNEKIPFYGVAGLVSPSVLKFMDEHRLYQ